MPTIKINSKEYEVEAGTTVLQAALANGIYIPHFCYHPYLAIAGNCRMCLADIKPGPPGKLSISCNTVVADNMEVQTETDQVKDARRAVMEFILKNHPVDCPICDQAGECVLHTYYVDYDLKPARVVPGDKVKKRKAVRVSSTLVLDTERCILCGRCVRYMRDVAGDDCLIIANRRDHSEITLFPGKGLESPYSLNLPDVCPVGAWTSADFRFKQRVWFLETTASVCPMCSRGCNTWIEHRRGETYRIRPRENAAVNKCWMCDMGRLSYHAVNDERLTHPTILNGSGSPEKASLDEALKLAAKLIKEAGDKLTVIVYASLSREEGKKALELFKDRLSARVLLHVGVPGPEDDLLRRSDLNANTRGLTDLGITDKLGDSVPEGSVIVSLETLCTHVLPDGVAPAVVVSPTKSLAAKAARVALPAASYVETAGTFVNFEGVRQGFKAAVSPPGQALPLTEILDKLGRLL